MTATIIGSTGLTGGCLIGALLADHTITNIVSVSRKSLNVSSSRLTQVLVADLAELPSFAGRARADIYFCALGTTIKAAGSKGKFERVDHDAIVDFAKIAKAHGAQSFTLVSSMGANASSIFFYNRIKGRTENDVTALGFRSLIIFRPALLIGPRHDFRMAERLATKTLVPLSRLLPTRARKSVVTNADALALRMLTEGKAARRGVHVIPAADI